VSAPIPRATHSGATRVLPLQAHPGGDTQVARHQRCDTQVAPHPRCDTQVAPHPRCDTQVAPHQRCDTQVAPYADIPGFCKAATLEDIRGHSYILTPGRYVGAAEVEDDGEPFEEKMERLTGELHEQMQEAAKLDALIWANLEGIGYGLPEQ